MKLRELNEDIAKACDVRVKAVQAVQAETFRRLLAAVEKGEKVMIPDFGIFSINEVGGKDGEPSRRVLKFKRREKTREKNKGGDEKATTADKEARRAKRQAKAAAKPDGATGEPAVGKSLEETAQS